MTIPIGYRFYACTTLSLLFALFWLWMYEPVIDGSQMAEFNSGLIVFCYLFISLIYGYFLDGILKASIRKLPFILYRLLYLYVLVKTGGALMSLMEIGIPVGFMPSVWSNLLLPLGIAFLPPLLMYWWAYIMETPFIRNLLAGAGGSAQWAGVRTFRNRPAKLKQSLFSSSRAADEGVTSERILLGRSRFSHDFFPRLIGVKPIMHFVLIALTRAGKSVSTVYNILLTYTSDVIVIDPKGELAETTFCRRASKSFLKDQNIKYVGDTYKNFEHGECYVLDPFGLTRFASCFYNPLSEIDIHNENAREMITAVCDGLVTPEGDKNKWAEEGARSFLSGLIAYALSELPSEKHNLSAVSDLLYGLDGNGYASRKSSTS